MLIVSRRATPLLGFLLCLVPTPGGAEEAGGPGTVEDIEACLQRTLPARTSIQRVSVDVADGEGELSRSRATIHWKRFESGLASVLLRFSEPPQRAGMAMLARQQQKGSPETYLYLPELRQTRRVSAKSAAGSMFGTDFSYEDFAYLQGVAERGERARLPDREIAGRSCYVLESVPDEAEAAYERVLYFLERERCTPLRAEFFGAGGTLRKVLEVDPSRVEAHGDRFIPMESVMRDLDAGTQTRVRVESIEPDVEIRDRFFEPSQLEMKGR